jgi:phosphatidylserine/phosphatidylglycerophosphate/cardiolipin synthase-like enzyme
MALRARSWEPGISSEKIDILSYSALFLAEDQAILHILTERAKTGVKVRILIGDPEAPEVATRGADEGIGAEVMAARVKNALALNVRPTQ